MGSIQSAINAAKAGDVIAVAEGSYAENLVLGSDGAYSSKNISSLGGYASDFSSRDAATFVSTIDGDGLARAVTIFVQANAETRIDGFVVAQGATTGTGGDGGGGIRAELMGSGPLVVSQNRVANNLTNPSASDAHGGMLDRLDSVTFAAPIFFHVVRFVFV
ncbi:MAG: phosphatidate cytidylyltransferase [Xanthomonadales bacterium]|nr:phosphatidate cytidylyltransferase [Xanthomonadales bacterium]